MKVRGFVDTPLMKMVSIAGSQLSGVFWFLVLLTLSSAADAAAAMNLRCEYMVNPLAIDMPKPRFFWKDRCEMRGFRQAAWQIEVNQGERVLGNSEFLSKVHGSSPHSGFELLVKMCRA